MTMPLRVAVLAKQVPRFEDLRLGGDGRLARDGTDPEINPYCRRAIAKGVELARGTGGRCTVFTMGPPQAADVLAEAIAWGADDGVLISDPALAGSDTLATSRALAAAISRTGPFDLVLAGLNSVDADTGQTPPQLAELLGLPFLSGVRELALDGTEVTARCERDDGFITARLRLPALLTAAERLCPPAKVPAAQRGDTCGRVQLLTAAELGGGPWGQQGSPTQVGELRLLALQRRAVLLSGPLTQQARDAAALIKRSAKRLPRGVPPALVPSSHSGSGMAGGSDDRGDTGPVVAVIAEPGRHGATRELLGAAARLAADLGGHTALLTSEAADPELAWRLGADEVIAFVSPHSGGAATAAAAAGAAAAGNGRAAACGETGGTRAGVALGASQTAAEDAEDMAAAIAAWARQDHGAGEPRPPGAADALPWAILAPSTSWGREVAGRVSARLAAGLTGDAVGLEAAGGRLVCWKPAFGGQVVAAVTARSAVQMATVRPGVLGVSPPRKAAGAAVLATVPLVPRGRVEVTGRRVNDEPERLTQARVVVCVGTGVDPSRYPELAPLLDALGAELAGTRKVTDAGWLPRSRQVGITGRAVAPAVYLLLGASGTFNHMVGARGAGLVVAVNADPDAPVFGACDAGIVADWAEFAPLLAGELATAPLRPA